MRAVTQARTEQAPASERSELDGLLDRDVVPREYRQAPLQTEDRLLEFLDRPTILGTIANAFPDPKLTEAQRAGKARKLVEECRILIANSDPKVRGPLLGCTTDSFVQAMSNCASMDLSLVKALGQACLVPYAHMATLMVQYQGFITLILRTGVVASVQAETVYKGEMDGVVVENGKPIIHPKRFDCERSDGAIVGVYAEARCLSGPPVNVMLNRQELEKIRRSSKAQDGPWKWWYGEMCKKSAIRRLHKQLAAGGDPIAQAALARAVELDNRDFGLAAKEAEAGLREVGAAARQRARQAKIVDAAPSPSTPPAPAPRADADELVNDAWIAKFMAAVKEARGGESDMRDEAWAEAVAGGPLAQLTRGQMTALVVDIKDDRFDPATGKRLPF